MKTTQKEWLGRGALAMFGLLLLGAGELGLRMTGFGGQYNFVIGSQPGHKEKSCLNSQYVALHYFKHLPINLSPLMNEKPWFQDTEFQTERDSSVYRIFMVGASTTRGFPFPGRQINYSRFLDLILKDVLPDRKVEIVNAGYDALSSFGVLDLTRQVVEQSPNMLVIYTGHNEFIGHFGVNSNINIGNQRWLMDLITQMHHSRLYLAGELMAMKLQSSLKDKAGRDSQVNMFRAMLSKTNITWNQGSHAQALQHYQENLVRMINIAKSKGIKVLLLNPASNLRDFKPVRSVSDERLKNTDAVQMKVLVDEGRSELKSGNIEVAKSILLSALQMDSGYAESHFLLGRVHEKNGNIEGARKEYRLARELDRIHLRACSQMQALVGKIGKKLGVPVVNLEKIMETVSPNGLVGENFFLEHVHPNINGHFVIADSIAHALSRDNKLGLTGSWDWARLKNVREYVSRVGYDARQFVQARYTIGRLLLDFPFFQCDAGEKILQRIKRNNSEQELIRACRKVETSSIYHAVTS